MTPSAQDRLGKLLRMLSSDKDGEVLAATAAIKRTLATEGLDIHSLADVLCQPAPRAEKAQRATHDTPDTTNWHGVARADHGCRASARSIRTARAPQAHPC